MPIPSIHEDLDRQCYALTQRGARCRNYGCHGEYLRQQVLRMDPADPALVDVLQDLAVLIHCKRWHQQERFGFVPAAKAAWLEELRRVPVTPRERRNISSPAHHAAVVRESTTQIERRSRPVTRAHAAAHGIGLEVPIPDEPKFEPYARLSTGKIHEAIAHKVPTRLHRSRSERTTSGHIYLYTRPGAPDFVKIGYSTNVYERLGNVQRNCDFEPNLVHKSPRLNNVARIEKLIFEQLRGLRYYYLNCIHRSSCGKKHEEWFKISTVDAIRVIQQWSDWAMQDPYDSSGRLKGNWVTYTLRWAEYCGRERLVNGLDLHYGCELPAQDTSDATAVTSVRQIEHHTHEDCTICYENLEYGQQQLRACEKCRNCWHNDCVVTWLATSNSCPMCRGRNTLTVTNV